MYHGCKTMSKEIADDDVIDDIIKPKSRSTFWTAVTLLIFKLKRQTNAQNVGNRSGYLDVILILKKIITVDVIMLWVITILASTQSPIAFSFCFGISVQLSKNTKWVRSPRYDCLVTWFCYQLIAKPGNKTAAPSWPDLYSTSPAHYWHFKSHRKSKPVLSAAPWGLWHCYTVLAWCL